MFTMNYWLVKSEPETYSWTDLVKDKKTMWDGVRNFAARLHLRAMKKGDCVLFYHSGDDKCVVGISEVVKEHYADPTAKEGDWSVVDIKPVKALKTPVTLAQVKAEKKLADIYLVRQGRLSVMPLKKSEFELIVKMGN
jgi:predicted RNA-binding protein with PUA-like domain